MGYLIFKNYINYKPENGYMKYDLVIFDLDGTIIDGVEYIWKTIHEFLGIEDHPKRIEHRDKFMTKEISYYDWAKKDLDLMVEYGADRAKILESLKAATVMNGAHETLKELKKRGYKLAIISGSMNVLLEELLPEYKEVFDYVFINKIFFDENGKIKDVEATPFDMEHKKTGLLKICKIEGIKPDSVAFVGDHKNDLEIAKIAGFTISFNSKSEELNKIADVVIEKKDLTEILKYL
ncbi:MAG: HAD family phosphatase [Candidatus Peribacteraceae bacterium]|nr:HAD family phosphatase [Candidatus Peribacteraceae bacterium]